MNKKQKIIGFMEFIHCERVIVVQAITRNDEFTKAAVVKRWKDRYGKKFLECNIKTHLLKKDQVVDKVDDQPLPDL